jgi:hypothetical protein
MIMKKFMVIVLIGIGIWTGCSKDGTTTSYTPSCSGAAKSYKTDVAPLIQSYCADCHSYGTYSKLFASRSSIRSMIVSGQMPQGKSLSTAQKDAIVCWMDSGAANN